MPRLAWFTPLPPVRSGISAYSAELLPRLAADAEIDVFVEGAPRPEARVFGAHDFVWRHLTRPYDLVVFQVGNAACHDYTWPYLVRFPGLVVLHDAQLHHARAQALLRRAQRAGDYRAEFRYCHPDAPAGVSEFFIQGRGGPLFYLWPLIRVAIRSARMVAVHSDGVARDLRERFPDARIDSIRMGVADPGPAGEAAAREVRQRFQIPGEAFVFAAFGTITGEKRIPQALEALARVAEVRPDARLLLVGDASAYDVARDARAHGVADRVVMTGYVDDAEVPACLAAADVCLCLRWPTSRETSASWLRCLAAGKPTVTTALAHTADVPALDPRTWTVAGLPPAPVLPGAGDVNPEPVHVSIDILDEAHSLGLAMRRLALSRELRDQLGRAARAFWAREHTLDRMAADYRRSIANATTWDRSPSADLPDHLRDDGTGLAREVARAFDAAIDFLEP